MSEQEAYDEYRVAAEYAELYSDDAVVVEAAADAKARWDAIRSEAA